MRGSEFAELNAFLEVAERGSFARAAARLGVTASALSQSVRQLEDRLGVRLLHRTTRSVAPTEAGERLLVRLRPAIDQIDSVTAALDPFRASPAGRLRLTASRVATALLLAPRLAAFRQLHPAIVLEVSVDDRSIDIVRHRFDAGIRRGALLDRDMIARRISADERLLAVAAPDYLARHGRPAHPRDLRGHDCIGIRRRASEAVPPWRFVQDAAALEVKISGGLVVDDVALALRAAVDGAGVAFLAETYVRADLQAQRLEAVLEAWAPPLAGFHLYYPSRRQVPPPVLALAEFLRGR